MSVYMYIYKHNITNLLLIKVIYCENVQKITCTCMFNTYTFIFYDLSHF